MGIEAEQDDPDPDDLNQRNQTLLDAIDQHPFHVHDVLADAGEQVPAGAVVVPGNRQPLEGAVQIPPEVKDHPLLKGIIETDAERVEPIPAKKNQGKEPNQPTQLVTAEAFGNDLIDQVTGQAGIDEPQHRGEQCGGKSAGSKTGVFAEISGDA